MKKYNWIYNELALTDIIKIRPIKYYRNEFVRFSHDPYGTLNESNFLQIEYEVEEMLSEFIPLSRQDLMNCAEEWKKNDKMLQSALDYIYLSKDIIR